MRTFVLIVALLMLGGCSSETSRSSAPTLSGDTQTASSSATTPPCRPHQLTAAAAAEIGTDGGSVKGTWTVPFALVNHGTVCLLEPRSTFVRAGHNVVQPESRITVPSHEYVVMHVVLARPHRACEPSDLVPEPLQLAFRVVFGNRTEVHERAVTGVSIPRGALVCPRRSLVEGQGPQEVPADLAVSAAPATALPHLALQAGLPRTDWHAPVWSIGPGDVSLPCGEDVGRYDDGAVLRRTVAVVAPDQRDQTRELDLYTSTGAARRAYNFLLDANRACPQNGEFGVTTHMFDSPLGAGSWALTSLDRGTGAGFTRSRYVVVLRGRLVVIDDAVNRSIRGQEHRLVTIVGSRPAPHA